MELALLDSIGTKAISKGWSASMIAALQPILEDKMANPSNQVVPFRLLIQPCCGIILCWVNPRRPMYCPECGERVFHMYPKIKWENTFSEAMLRVENYDKADYFLNNPLEKPFELYDNKKEGK